MKLPFRQARGGHGESAGGAIVVGAEVARRAGGDKRIGSGIQDKSGGVNRQREEQGKPDDRK